MHETLDSIVGPLVQYLLIPALLIISSAVLVIIQKMADKITKSFTQKHDTESLAAVTTMKCNLITKLNAVTETAVKANMQLAYDLKGRNKKLTEEQIQRLNTSARKIILDSLPEDIKDNGMLVRLFGSKEALETMIDSLIEKHVLEHKMQINGNKF